MKKSIQDKMDSIRIRASKDGKFISETHLSKEKSSLSQSIRNKKEAENFRIAYESAKVLARKNNN
ncbi:hypothetical protein [Chryseobacterium luteum]|uniref:Uncharacterized protein n=1 Tax=Chryseobacterium luteum TaxID=421531 RepID=A0A085ZTT4_9FLAO|nr:hypothetical protein [Chryseobacterium luteum]KFF07848.1 hypothetical protein IX38_09120 [Chryseobacterium luteum]